MTTTPQALISEARKAGAKAAEVLVEQHVGHSVGVERGRVVRKTRVSGDRVTVRCWIEGGGVGEAGGALKSGSKWVKRAVAAAKKAAPDRFAGPVGRNKERLDGLGIDDRRFEGITMDDRVDIAVSAEKSARNEDRRVTTGAFGYEDQRVHRVLVNTKGASLEERSTRFEVFGAVECTSKSDPIHLTDRMGSRAYSSTASLPLGVLLARRAVELLAKRQTISGAIPVMLPPRATASLVAAIGELFVPAKLKASFLHGLSLHESLHVIDDGRLSGGLRTRSFDDRGVPPMPMPLLREGTPTGQFLDPRTARQMELVPTGHLREGRLQPSNLTLRSGTRSMNAILKDQDTTVLMVDSLPMDRFDPVTGELVATVHGTLFQGNEPQGAVIGATIKGTLGEVLKQVRDVASDTDRVLHVDAPGLLLDGFEIS